MGLAPTKLSGLDRVAVLFALSHEAIIIFEYMLLRQREIQPYPLGGAVLLSAFTHPHITIIYCYHIR